MRDVQTSLVIIKLKLRMIMYAEYVFNAFHFHFQLLCFVEIYEFL